jgi:putative FmdB family regulatory protein
MALYDFTCLECSHVFEVFSPGFIKEEQKQCPVCGSQSVRQKFTSFLRNGSSARSGCGAPSSSGFG